MTATKQINPTEIEAAVSQVFGVSVKDMRLPGRIERNVVPRQVAMFLIREKTDLIIEDIGGLFGKDSATVHYALRAIKNRNEVDAAFRAKVEAVRAIL